MKKGFYELPNNQYMAEIIIIFISSYPIIKCLRRVFRVRASLGYATILFIVIAIQPAMAFTEMAIPFITTCDTIYMQPMESADATVIEFNDVHIADTSLETLNIDFPAFADGIHLGPTVASDTAAFDGALATDSASFNVLPFGLVNLAFPSIEQTADETYAYQRTYFFTDTGPP